MPTRIELRGDTAANWTAVNPVLATREEGVETDTLRRKLGDGVTAWNNLPYAAVVPADAAATYIAQNPAAAQTITGQQLTIQNTYLVLADNRGPANAPQINMDGNAGHWIQGIDVANQPTSAHLVPVGKIGTYAFYDGATTAASAVLTSPAQGQFTSTQVGKPISGPGIPAGTTVLSVQSPTSLTLSANATATASGVTVTITDTNTYDQFFINHGGGKPPAFGFGVTPPDLSATMQVIAGPNGDPGRGALKLQQTVGATGNLLTLADSNASRLWIDANFVVSGNNGTYGSAFVVQGDATNNRSVSMIDNTKGAHWAWEFTGVNYLSLRSVSGSFSMLTVDSSQNLQLGTASGGVGFFGAAAVAQPSAGGAAAGYAAGATAATFHSDDTYTGNVGVTAYTINGLVAALKGLGLVKS